MSSYGFIENNSVKKIERKEDFERLDKHEDLAMKVLINLAKSVSNTL